MVPYNRSNTQSITAKSQTLNLSMKIANTHNQLMQIYELFTGVLKAESSSKSNSKVNVKIICVQYMDEKHISCRQKLHIDV